MSKCILCGRDRTSGYGCPARNLVCNGKEYERIKVMDIWCPECNSVYLGFHHYGCSREICPVCKKQFVDCRCEKHYRKSKEQ